MSVEKLIVDHMETWTSALQTRSTAGRGSSGKIDLYGIKKLRELILELAVRGKLVPQDPNDEPASDLLKRIAAEKAELVKQGKIKKQKPLPEISEEEKPFELPEGWEWVHLPDIYCSISESSRKIKSSEILPEGKYPVIEQSQEFISGYCNNECLLIKLNNPVIVFGDHTRNIIFIDFDFVVGADGVKILSPILICERFFFWQLRSFKLDVRGYARHFKVLNSCLFALPPIAEQERIVEKVSSLMSLCDQLEQQSLTSLDAHQQLVETLLGTLTDSQNTAELAENWARISEHFDTLFTTEASVDALKQTILQLAVMGKLVPQDPNDEPASELLKRIAQEKAQLVKEGKIKKQKPLPPISDEEKPFELPEGWEWCRIGNIVNIKSELVSPKDYLNLYQVAPDIIEKGTGRVISKRTVKESGVKGPNSRFYKGQIVYSKIRPSLSKVFLAEYNGLCSADMYPLDCYINPNYLLKYILSIPFLMQVKKAENRIKMPKLNSDSFYNIIVAIPPYNEQQAIFDKINSIEAVCNGLISYIGIYHKTQLHLADALTDAAIN
ncbi:restriction endonuclease subunit S [Shigella flexneri]|uniref:restriction endonuclease subunit S n=1 Tax=Shigella flexneri TaxID=623 RepID=UPI0005374175|nr:restriction endonuclease subunit S [Shigella flexneri]EHR5187555.1 restriction endonuclease subunit S [Escherichia coli]HAY5781755.1 restriction endonuclease subunit S [Shigella flexneri 3b]AUU33210.1 restriction endonuclease subunit S [Shigella flexneri]EFW3839176.1 restriction endonuclease subunit S [Shigella flexneri]EFW8889571.1 restriction endonuclease subunit S [Shigella flexneri]